MHSLQNDRSVVIKPADKGSAVVVWHRTDFLKEAERQLSDEKTYEEIRITEEDQVELVEKSNNLFSNLKKKNVINVKNVCSTWVPPLISLDSGGIITRKTIRKLKEGRNICSHLFLSIFLQMIITVS